MKKILIVNTVAYVVGGISTVIMNYYKALPEFQYDFVVDHFIDERYKTLIEEGGSRYFVLERNKNPVRYAMQLFQIIRENHYDIVHVHGNSYTMGIELLAAKMAGCKIRIAHSHNSTCEHKIFSRMLQPFFEFFCNVRLACSEEAGKWLYKRKKFHVISNALNMENYVYSEKKRWEVRHTYSIPDAAVLLGHIGFFNEQKNQTFLIQLLSELEENYYLMFVGEGHLLEDVKKKARELGVSHRVVFCGNSDNVPAMLSAMDIFVFPSKWEGLGIVMIEAQLMGLPCVASTNVPEITKLHTESYYCPEILSEWKKQMITLSKKSDRYTLQRQAQEHCELYDIKVQAETLRRIYEYEQR